MNTPESVREVIKALNDLDIPYMVVGSLSSNVYGIPRSTVDADFVIETDERIEAISQAIAGHFKPEPQLGFETIGMTTKHLFYERESSFRIELFVLSQDDFAQTRFDRRVRIDAGGLPMFLPTAEDVVVQKLRWGRMKDMADAVDVIKTQANKLDWPYIRQWCMEHGSVDRLHTALQEAGLPTDQG